MDYMESEEMIDLDLNWEFLALIAMESSVTRFKDTFQKKKFWSNFSSSGSQVHCKNHIEENTVPTMQKTGQTNSSILVMCHSDGDGDGLVWKKVSPMDVITSPQSTAIFPCIGPVTNKRTIKQTTR